MDNSTKVENPVNKITELLSGMPETLQTEPERPEGDQTKPETAEPEQDALDSSAEEPQVESPTQTEEPEETDHLYLNDFANEAGIDMGDAYEMSLKMPDNESKTLSELKNFYLDNKDIDSQRLDIKNREQDLQAESDSLREVPQVSNELMQARAQVLSIQDQYNRTNWDDLRVNNVQEWTARQQEFQNAFNIAKENERLAGDKVETQKSQARAFQQDRLYESMPDLKNDKVRQEAGVRVQALASKYGFTPSDVANIEDSRLMRLLIDASKLDKASSGAKAKLEAEPPKANSPSASKPLPGRKASLKRLTEKAKATGQRRDQVNAVSALLQG